MQLIKQFCPQGAQISLAAGAALTSRGLQSCTWRLYPLASQPACTWWPSLLMAAESSAPPRLVLFPSCLLSTNDNDSRHQICYETRPACCIIRWTDELSRCWKVSTLFCACMWDHVLLHNSMAVVALPDSELPCSRHPSTLEEQRGDLG